jgi:signal peptidase I
MMRRRPGRRPTLGRGRRRRRWVSAGAVLLLLVAARTWVAEPFAIPSASMEPTLRRGDQILVDKLAYRRTAPRRGDLALFTAGGTRTVLLKRIVALPGDRVAIEDGVLAVNGRLRRERYVDYSRVDSVYFGPVVVPEGRVFVLGDNRGDSRDSRDFGAVPEQRLIGRVLLRIWPPAR